MISRRHIANPIAVRRYAVVGEPDREVVLTIGKPRLDPRPGGDWVRSILIEGIPREGRYRSHGADAIGALQDAMICARRILDASNVPLTWLDGEPGALDLPLSVPTAWGLAFQRRLERYLRRQERMFALAVTAAGKARERRRRPPNTGL